MESFIDFRKNQRTRDIIVVLLSVVLCVLTELFLFNFRYFIPKIDGAKTKTVNASEFVKLDRCKYDTKSGEIIVFPSSSLDTSAAITIKNVNLNIYNVRLKFSQPGGSFDARVDMSDKNSSKKMLFGESVTVSELRDGSECMTVVSSGKARDIRLAFLGVRNASVHLESVTFNQPYFDFNFYRFLFVFLVIFGVYFVKSRNLQNEIISRNSYRADLTFAIILSLCVCSSIVLFYFAGKSPIITALPDIPNAPERDLYQLLTNSLAKGKVSLDFPVDPKLSEIANPYDRSVRDNLRIDCLWDSAFYNGKYYCYFGIVPALLVMLPFKLLTSHNLSTGFVTCIFQIGACISFLLLYRNIVRRWFKNANLLLYLTGAVILAFGSNLFYSMARAKFYELAVTSAMFFLYTALNMLFLYDRQTVHKSRYLFLAGLFLGLMVGSRPNYIIYIVLAVPFLVRHVLLKKGGLRETVKGILPIAAPLAVCAIGVMAYNFARFGSVFEFGSNYQLTVSDIRYNTLTNFPKFANSIYNTFFVLPGFSSAFPFLADPQQNFVGVTQFNYSRNSVGLITFPFLWLLPIFAFPVMKKAKNKMFKVFCLTVAGTAMVMAVIVQTVGGSDLRYVLDYYPLLLLVTVLMMHEVYKYAENLFAKKVLMRLFIIIGAVTCFVSMMLVFQGDGRWIETHSPSAFYALKRTFEFWI